jgi:hypothetical protein
VLPVAEAAGNAAVEFDEAVDRFGAAVVRAAGVEVGQERLAPLLERLAVSLISGIGQVGSDARTFSRILDTVGDYAAVGSVVARRAS